MKPFIVSLVLPHISLTENKSMIKKLVFLIALLIQFSVFFAQKESELSSQFLKENESNSYSKTPESPGHKNFESFDYDDDHYHKFEVGIGSGLGYVLNEDVFAAVFHFHLIKSLGKKQKFSAGPGLEFFLDKHKHASVEFSFAYRPIHPLYIAVSPGISIPLSKNNSEERSTPGYATHFEILYEFEFDHVHVGPMMEYAYAAEDQHFVLALHFGINF